MRFKKQPKRPSPKTKVQQCAKCQCLQKHTQVLTEVPSALYRGHMLGVQVWMCNVCGHKE